MLSWRALASFCQLDCIVIWLSFRIFLLAQPELLFAICGTDLPAPLAKVATTKRLCQLASYCWPQPCYYCHSTHHGLPVIANLYLFDSAGCFNFGFTSVDCYFVIAVWRGRLSLIIVLGSVGLHLHCCCCTRHPFAYCSNCSQVGPIRQLLGVARLQQRVATVRAKLEHSYLKHP